MKLNKDQRKLTADVFGNLSVGWFGAGIIVPLLSQKVSTDFVKSFVIGFVISLIFYVLALLVLKR